MCVREAKKARIVKREYATANEQLKIDLKSTDFFLNKFFLIFNFGFKKLEFGKYYNQSLVISIFVFLCFFSIHV